MGALEALIRQNDYLKGFFAPFAWPPDIGRLILDQGYPQEQHWVSTEDGYMLQLFRIARYRTKTEAPPVVMLVSGLLVRRSSVTSRFSRRRTECHPSPSLVACYSNTIQADVFNDATFHQREG